MGVINKKRHIRVRGTCEASWRVDVRLTEKRNSNSHGARPVHQIISTIKRTQTSKFAIRNALSAKRTASEDWSRPMRAMSSMSGVRGTPVPPSARAPAPPRSDLRYCASFASRAWGLEDRGQPEVWSSEAKVNSAEFHLNPDLIKTMILR